MDGKIFYVTKEKLKDLKKEYEDLIAFERRKTIAEEAPKLFESEDMNPEFVSYYEDMNTLRARIDELDDIMKNHELIKPPVKEKQTLVGIGAKVGFDVNGKHDEFTIVGTLEANPEAGMISNESPVGAALLGRKVGEEVIIPTPTKKTYTIKHITYEIS